MQKNVGGNNDIFNNSHRFKDVDESLALTKRCWSVDIQCVIYTVHRPHTRYNTVGRGLGGLWWKQDNFLFWNSRRFDYLRRNTPLKTSSNTAYMSALPQVTLPCRVENKIGVIQWTRDGFGLGDTRDLSGSAANRSIVEVVQSRRRPLLGPSPGWKRLLPLSHLRHY